MALNMSWEIGTLTRRWTGSVLFPSCASTSYTTPTKTPTTGSPPRTSSGVRSPSNLHDPRTRKRLYADRLLAVSIEFSLSIIVACLPALTPLLKRMSGLSNLIPSIIRSKFTLKSSQKLSGDVEHGRHERYPSAPWQTPREWKKPGHKQSFDTRGSKESEMALQPMQPTHRELNHKD